MRFGRCIPLVNTKPRPSGDYIFREGKRGTGAMNNLQRFSWKKAKVEHEALPVYSLKPENEGLLCSEPCAEAKNIEMNRAGVVPRQEEQRNCWGWGG